MNHAYVEIETEVDFCNERIRNIRLQREIVKKLKESLDLKLRGFSENMGVFRISEDSLMELYETEEMDTAIQLVYLSDKGYQCTADINYLNGEYLFQFRFTKEDHEIVYAFDESTKTWKKKADVGWINQIMEKRNEESLLFAFLCQQYPNFTENYSLKKFQKYCIKNRQILLLYKRLDGLVRFEMIPKNLDISDTDLSQIAFCRLALVPDDISCRGTAVYYDNGYRICQYLDCLDVEEALLDSGYDVDDDEIGLEDRLLKTVVIENDLLQASDLVEWYLDHYAGHGNLYIFPLSETAYARSREPFAMLQLVTEPEGRRLTNKENELADYIQNFPEELESFSDEEN